MIAGLIARSREVAQRFVPRYAPWADGISERTMSSVRQFVAGFTPTQIVIQWPRPRQPPGIRPGHLE